MPALLAAYLVTSENEKPFSSVNKYHFKQIKGVYSLKIGKLNDLKLEA